MVIAMPLAVTAAPGAGTFFELAYCARDWRCFKVIDSVVQEEATKQEPAEQECSFHALDLQTTRWQVI
jgi:hypothetical protein